MKRFWRVLLILLVVVSTTPAVAALQASVDRNPVNVNESFTLTLQSDDNLNGTPDLSALQQDFEVINQGKSSSFQFINGTTSRSIEWSITLMPKHSGQVRIPPISIGNQQSAPITLTVNTATAAGPGPTTQGDLFLEVTATPHEVYVQQQVLYTVRLFHAVNLGNNATLTEPKLAGDDAIVEKLGDDKNYQTTRNGMRYAVVERRYAIYPQHSGPITIPPLAFEGDVVQPSANSFFNFDPFATNTQHRRAVSAPVTLTARAAPALFQDKPWLPASNLQLVEQWSPDPPHFTVGQPITRTVAVMADGLTAAQLPPLERGIPDGLKQYPDQPSLKDTKARDGITGIRSEKIALIPMHPGTITLPAITLPWWNTATNEAEVARLPARTVTVAPATDSPAAANPPAPASETKQLLAPPPSEAAAPHNAAAGSVAAAGTEFWPWLALLLGLGWLGTALAWWWQARHSAQTSTRVQGGNESLRQREKAIKRHCLDNDASGCSRALLAWAHQRWPEHPPVSLTALAQRCSPSLAKELRALDRARYASLSAEWQGQPLWQAFSSNRLEKTAAATNSAALRPLYTE